MNGGRSMSERDETPRTEPGAPVLSYQSPGSESSQRWTTVWQAANSFEANLAVTKLQEIGIHARVDMENAATLGPVAGVMNGTRVQVLADDAPAARTLLNEIDLRRARRQEAARVRCPNCTSAESKRILHPIRWCGLALIAVPFVLLPFGELVTDFISPGWLMLSVIAGIAMLIWWGVTPHWLCRSCGHRWYAKEPEELEEDEDLHETDDGDDEDDKERDK
jgi:hypothetical protein